MVHADCRCRLWPLLINLKIDQPLRFNEIAINSLFSKILPVTLTRSRFCRHFQKSADCFQYFAIGRGRGVPPGLHHNYCKRAKSELGATDYPSANTLEERRVPSRRRMQVVSAPATRYRGGHRWNRFISGPDFSRAIDASICMGSHHARASRPRFSVAVSGPVEACPDTKPLTHVEAVRYLVMVASAEVSQTPHFPKHGKCGPLGSS